MTIDLLRLAEERHDLAEERAAIISMKKTLENIQTDRTGLSQVFRKIAEYCKCFEYHTCLTNYFSAGTTHNLPSREWEVFSLDLELQPSTISKKEPYPSPYQACAGIAGALIVDVALTPHNMPIRMFTQEHPPAFEKTVGDVEAKRAMCAYYGGPVFRNFEDELELHFPTDQKVILTNKRALPLSK